MCFVLQHAYARSSSERGRAKGRSTRLARKVVQVAQAQMSYSCRERFPGTRSGDMQGTCLKRGG